MVKLGAGMLHNNPHTNKFIDLVWQLFTDDENWQVPMNSQEIKGDQQWLKLKCSCFADSENLRIL